MTNNNSPQTPNITLPESGEFNLWTNIQNSNISQNYKITYERLSNSNPQTPQYQLRISSGVGAGAEFLARISTSATYEIGMNRIFGYFHKNKLIFQSNILKYCTN